ncbi:hypothetical protein [Nocardia sp. R6R-6]|uniref:hypothetical protein n=1 Tax=Nocardia sp. R6R-6 TaxID=3459303 RepID=UPI00403E235D
MTAGERGVAAIHDPVREAEISDVMARLGDGLDLPENGVRQLFFGRIEANKAVQRGLLLQWRFDPAAAPTSLAGLWSVRPVIDQVNLDILDQLGPARRPPSRTARTGLRGKVGAQRLRRVRYRLYRRLVSGRAGTRRGRALPGSGAGSAFAGKMCPTPHLLIC